MELFSWLIIGAIAGWLASIITGNGKRMGVLLNILVGVIGGFIGGIIMDRIGNYGMTGFNLWSLLVATGGAVVLLLLVNLIARPKKR